MANTRMTDFELATAVDQLMYDFDPYGYGDATEALGGTPEEREEGRDFILSLIDNKAYFLLRDYLIGMTDGGEDYTLIPDEDECLWYATLSEVCVRIAEMFGYQFVEQTEGR